MISGPRRLDPRVFKSPTHLNPYAWRQDRQLWSLFGGLWLFSATILGCALFLISHQYDFFIQQAYRAFPQWVSYLEREEEIAFMIGAAGLLAWTPVLFFICKRWTSQTFNPLIFFHQEINSLSLRSTDKKTQPYLPVAEFHEFYESYQSFFDEMRMQRIKEAEVLRAAIACEDMETMRIQLRQMLKQKESELGTNVIKLTKSAVPSVLPTSGSDVSPAAVAPRRRVS
ncbi:MAG: hypothetical protein V4736_06790 [Bdellovibrionota bacterium]